MHTSHTMHTNAYVQIFNFNFTNLCEQSLKTSVTFFCFYLQTGKCVCTDRLIHTDQVTFAH